MFFLEMRAFGSPPFRILMAPETAPTPRPEPRLVLCTRSYHPRPERVAPASAQTQTPFPARRPALARLADTPESGPHLLIGPPPVPSGRSPGKK